MQHSDELYQMPSHAGADQPHHPVVQGSVNGSQLRDNPTAIGRSLTTPSDIIVHVTRLANRTPPAGFVPLTSQNGKVHEPITTKGQLSTNCRNDNTRDRQDLLDRAASPFAQNI